MRKFHKTAAAVAAAILLLGSLLFAGGQLPVASAAQGAAKAVFDVRIGKPAIAASHLKLIHETFRELKEAGKRPKVVVVFIGPSVKLISSNRSGFAGDELKALDEIAKTVAAMAKDGIQLEICMVAAGAFHVDPASVLPQIRKVPNGWISLISYQSRGYALVPAY